MSTTVIEFAADEFGDWFFHCHLLYHMKSGMVRFIHYDGFQPNPAVTAIQKQADTTREDENRANPEEMDVGSPKAPCNLLVLINRLFLRSHCLGS
jgi:hypothetical protein